MNFLLNAIVFTIYFLSHFCKFWIEPVDIKRHTQGFSVNTHQGNFTPMQASAELRLKEQYSCNELNIFPCSDKVRWLPFNV